MTLKKGTVHITTQNFISGDGRHLRFASFIVFSPRRSDLVLQERDMNKYYSFLGLCIALPFISAISSDGSNSFAVQEKPAVMIALLVRNKAHVLPWSLYYIQNLNYEKSRISLW